MNDNNPKFTIEFGSTCLTITFKERDGREVYYHAVPQDDMSASTRIEFLSSIERWVDESSDCYTDIDISVRPHVVPVERCIAAIAHDTP